MPLWRDRLNQGQVIPACPLMLHQDGSWSERHQAALLRYYVAAGAGGLAVGVHSTQFEIRAPQHGLLQPLLRLAGDVLNAETDPQAGFVRIAGVCGPTAEAVREARLARDCGFHAGLLSFTALRNQAEHDLIEHTQRVADVIPVVGFYLQPAVGGRVLSYGFWRELCDVSGVVAIKIAPFNRYFTGDVVRAVIESGREDLVLYTGNDDNIINDLLTPFSFAGQRRFLVGGLLGQWGVWTQAAVGLFREIKAARTQEHLAAEWLTRNAALTDLNAAVFDSANAFAGCIPGINEVLRRQGLAPSNRCLNDKQVLSPGQAAELDRVIAAYPQFVDDNFVRTHLDHWLQ